MSGPGERIGEYLLETELARGGMGAVFRARHLPSGRPVALKLLLRLEPAQRARLAREAGALARILHPHLVRLLDAGEHHGRPFLVLELVEGRTLGERIAREGRLSPLETRELGRALGSALAALHAAGLVHRDVKPDNVLLAQDGRPRLADLGLVKDLDPEASRLSRSGVFMGTPGYWAPEQALGEQARIGPHTDIHGLGAVLYACLSGQAPYPTRDLGAALLQAERGQPPPPPSAQGATVPPDLEAVVMRCLEPRPEQRYPTAQALLNALDAAATPARASAPLAGLPRTGLPLRVALVTLALGGVGAVAVLLSAPGGSALISAPGREDRAAAGTVASAPTGAPTEAPTQAPTEAPSDEPALVAARWLGEARSRRERGDVHGAREAVERSLAARESADAYELRAALLLDALEDPLRALEDLERALAQDPDHVRALVGRGTIRAQQADFRGALLDFDRAVAVAPEELLPRANRGAARVALGDLPGALEDLDAVLTRDPDDGPSLLARAHVWSRRGDSAHMAADLTRYLGRHPHAPGADAVRLDLERLRAPQPGEGTPLELSNRGVQRERAGDLQGALDDYTRALTLDPALGSAWINRAALRGRRGDLQGALLDARRAVEVAPGDPDAWMNLALGWQTTGDLRAAGEAYDRTLALDPGRSAALYNRGLCHDGLGETARARACWERVVALAPGSPEARAARAALTGPPGGGVAGEGDAPVPARGAR